MSSIRVILADDYAVVRKGIRDFLEEDGDIEVVAEAGDGEKVKALILASHFSGQLHFAGVTFHQNPCRFPLFSSLAAARRPFPA